MILVKMFWHSRTHWGLLKTKNVNLPVYLINIFEMIKIYFYISPFTTYIGLHNLSFMIIELGSISTPGYLEIREVVT